MSKFHDEFFRKTTPDHDELIVITIDNLEKIVDKVIPIKNYIDETKEKTVYICSYENKPHFCSLAEGYRTAFYSEPTCLKNNSHYNFTIKGETIEKKEYYRPDHLCRFFKLPEVIKVSEIEKDNYLIQKHFSSEPYLEQIKPQKYEIKTCTYEPYLETNNVKMEPETICRVNDFIIGYADIVVDIIYSIKYDLIIEKNWISKNEIIENHAFRIIIDAKPELKSWGGPLRQLKTYMQTLGRIKNVVGNCITHLPIGVITTFSKIPEKHKEILQSENVEIIEFDKSGTPSLSEFLTETKDEGGARDE